MGAPKEKQEILDRALATPEDPNSKIIIQKARERGWLGQEPAPGVREDRSVLGKVGAASVGASEAVNPLSAPRSIETLGRGAWNYANESEVTPEISSGVAPIYKTRAPKSFSEYVADAEEKAVMPDLSVRRGISLLPGGKERLAELPKDWENYGGLFATILSLGAGLKGAIKGSKVRQAEKSLEKTTRDIKFLTGEAEGPVLTAMIDRPEEVARLLKDGKLSANDIALSLAEQLAKKREVLGKRVGEFRDLVGRDTTRKIQTKNFKNIASGAEESVTLEPQVVARTKTVDSKVLGPDGLPVRVEKTVNEKIGGGSLFSSKDQAQIDEVMSMLQPESISPRDAMLVVDKIDEMTKPEKIARGNISDSAAYALTQIRGKLKNVIRSTTDDAKAWAKADDEFSTFVGNADAIQRKLDTQGSASFVDNLLSKNKEPIRDQLFAALNVGESGNPADDFLRQLSNTKAAQGMKALDVTKADPIRDQLNRMFQRYMSRATWAGASVGSAIGAKAGPVGALIGMPTGGFVGRIAMEPIARRLSSPQHLLNQAMRAKVLSKEAQQLAQDLNWVQKNLGIEGANLFWNTIKGGVPAANELATYLGAAR